MKKVLFVTSEAVPYIKTGGLADVTGSLPKYFNKQEYDVRIILPKYVCIEEQRKKEMNYVDSFYVNLNWRKQYAGIFQAEYGGIIYYFIDNEYYFAGEKPYYHIYEDTEKFAFFAKAAIEAMKKLDFQADIVHCHDWQTGLVPVFLRNSYANDCFYQRMKIVYTIHNMKFQGRWKIEEIKDITGLPNEIFAPDKLESYGESNYLKGGIVYSDFVTTVSRTYAYEITTSNGGEGLDGVMRAKEKNLLGIVNGIDYEEYNPMTDAYIPYHYQQTDVLIQKPQNKETLQKRMELPIKENVFLIGIVSRLTSQKGFDLVAHRMDEMIGLGNIQIVVLGTGEKKYENMFRYYTWKYQEQVAVSLNYSEELAHLIYAGADAFLMPSLFEPCGLSQLMSMRYGTLPMVRETGGLKDTVIPYNEYEQTGNGFSFANYNADEMFHMICYAKNIYENYKENWNQMIKRAMDSDYSWEMSAQEYEQLYARL